MTEQKQILSAQEYLAQEIIDALIEKKLISANKKKKLTQQVAMGLLDAEDWTLLIDMATEQEANNGQASDAE
ncbi:hypothetical protein BMS3Abin11_00348 [bacterium BMS3Abin11]|nr:hypothetical protein BMS3Abin11_00348 [bacterium BMS3Abin11]